MSRVRDRDVATDIYQESVRALLESRCQFASLEHLRSYFFVTLRHKAADHFRARGAAPSAASAGELARAKAPAADEPAARLAIREEAERQRERLERLGRAVDALSAEERALLEWRFWDRKTFREIRELTATAISTLKSREDAILRRLARALGEGPESERG